ncbi:MAG: MBL fold metallo-hydrolase [Anaerolineae bacterium]|nr:MBL fold metallo-hydrolase [Anaerolineae bacterium]
MDWQVIKTGRVWVDPGGPFGLVPAALWKKTIKPNDKHLIPMDLNCLLIQSDGKVIVVDTGLGDKLDERGRRNWGISYPEGTLIGNLAKHGIKPEDVDIVIDTHLHWDHCGGNTTIVEGEVKATFPRAEYYVQYSEWADAMHPNARTRGTYLAENYRPIWEAGKMHFMFGDETVTSEVRCAVTPGHTRGHQSVIAEGDGETVFYPADLSTFAVHMQRTGWVTAYDVEPLETIRTKKQWQEWALETQATMVFEHDTNILKGKLQKDKEGKLMIEKIE